MPDQDFEAKTGKDQKGASAMLQSIWRIVAAVPPGRVITYGEVARLAGMPRSARRVGPALGKAPSAMRIPWHRVVAAGGRIALPEDSPDYHTQIRKLRAEGVTVENGRVDLAGQSWTPDLDELLWGPDASSQG
ncbi:MAG: methylated-DNA--[protein]-cysteine S-methyltransferase [Gammaproteobacteria bacterium]